MSIKQEKPGSSSASAVAVVGKSVLFPVSLSRRTFWPHLLTLKGLMAGLIKREWPFSEVLSAEDFSKLERFVVTSGLLSSRGLPGAGFEIPEELLSVARVLCIIPLFLANQALHDTLSWQANTVSAGRVAVVFEKRGAAFRLMQAPPPGSAHAASAVAPAGGNTDNPAVAFARQHGFRVATASPDVAAPVPGALSWLSGAVVELQSGAADLVIAGSVDGVHCLNTDLEHSTRLFPGTKTRFREGLGMLAMRRLGDAERDGDNILAVLSDFDGVSLDIAIPGLATNASVAGSAASPVTAGADGNVTTMTGSLSGVAHGSSSSITTDFSEIILGRRPVSDQLRREALARFARLPLADLVAGSNGSCPNLPLNCFPDAGATFDGKLGTAGSARLCWQRLRDQLAARTGSRRFFHDLLGILLGTFVSRVIIRSPEAFAAVAGGPVLYLANHQIGLESPLFMTLSFGLTGVPVQAVAKPDHVDAWLSFLMEFAKDSLGSILPFRLLYFDRMNPRGLIEALKQDDAAGASLLVHVEGTRALTAGQPVKRLSSVFLDMAVEKNLPVVPVRFVGGLPEEPTDGRLDFPYNNGKQDYIIGTPIAAEQLRQTPYGQRPRLIMESINNLGPGIGEDVVLPPSPEFVEKTRFFMDTFGLPKFQAMLFAILQFIDEPCDETALLIKALQSGKLDPSRTDFPPVLKNFLVHIKTKL